MENNNEEKKGIYLNIKTYPDSYKAILKNNPNLISIQTFFIDKEKHLYRNKYDEVISYDNQKDKKQYDERILNIGNKNGNLLIKNLYKYTSKSFVPTKTEIESVQNSLWYIVNSINNRNNKIDENDVLRFNYTNEDYYLCPNDIINFGNEIYAITELPTNDENDKKKDENSVYDIHFLNYNKKPKFNSCYEIKSLDDEDDEIFCPHIIKKLKGLNPPELNDIKEEFKKNNIIKNRKGKVTRYEIFLKKCEVINCKNHYR